MNRITDRRHQLINTLERNYRQNNSKEIIDKTITFSNALTLSCERLGESHDRATAAIWPNA